MNGRKGVVRCVLDRGLLRGTNRTCAVAVNANAASVHACRAYNTAGPLLSLERSFKVIAKLAAWFAPSMHFTVYDGPEPKLSPTTICFSARPKVWLILHKAANQRLNN